MARNVLGGPLAECGISPVTGFYRDCRCHTGVDDLGRHVVCAVMDQDFLDFSLSQGNDLITAMPAVGFPGLVPGDRWCLCVARWAEALDAGVAPVVVLEATHERALEVVELDQLRAHSSAG